MEYCAAAAVNHGRVDLAAFAETAPPLPLADRVRMVVDPSLPDGVEQRAWSRVTVRLRDGRVLAAPAGGAAGHHDRPLSDEALREKFLACAGLAIDRAEAEGLADQLGHLDDVPDIRALTARLVGA
jgi:2-methylcitrate dehydratase PrpD